jgi:HD-like signal output (HDOD) protein
MKPKNNDITELQNGIARVLKLRQVLSDGKISALMGNIEQMPKLPLIFNEFSDAVRREGNFQQLAEIISKDTAVAAKLLQISNSAFFSSEKTASLEQAIMMLGVNATRDIVLTATLAERGAPRNMHADYFQKIMKHSLVVNKYMEPFSRMIFGKSIDRNYKSVGLTHDIGKIILLQNFPDRFDKIVSLQLRNPKASFYDCEIALGFGDCTHAEIGAYLLDLWNFPTISVEVALYHHTPTLARDTQYNEILRIASVTNEVVNYLSQSSNLESVNLNDFLKAIKNELM